MATVATLHGEALRAAVVPWREEVGRADRERLDALVRLATSERTRLSDCLQVTFPGQPTRKALAALTSFRKRINDAAEAARPPLVLRFQVDTRKQSPPAERECWFAGPDPDPRKAAHRGGDLSACRRIVLVTCGARQDDAGSSRPKHRVYLRDNTTAKRLLADLVVVSEEQGPVFFDVHRKPTPPCIWELSSSHARHKWVTASLLSRLDT